MLERCWEGTGAANPGKTLTPALSQREREADALRVPEAPSPHSSPEREEGRAQTRGGEDLGARWSQATWGSTATLSASSTCPDRTGASSDSITPAEG